MCEAFGDCILSGLDCQATECNPQPSLDFRQHLEESVLPFAYGLFSDSIVLGHATISKVETAHDRGGRVRETQPPAMCGRWTCGRVQQRLNEDARVGTESDWGHRAVPGQ